MFDRAPKDVPPAPATRPAFARPGRPRPADLIALQRTAGNDAVQRLVNGGGPPAIQRQVAGSAKAGFKFPERKLGPKRIAPWLEAALVVGGAYTVEVAPPSSGPAGPVSVSGGPTASPDATKYQAEAEYKFNQLSQSWLGSWTPAVKLAGSGDSSGGYKLSAEGELAAEFGGMVEAKLGFTFLEAEREAGGTPTIKFLELAAELEPKLPVKFDFREPDGTKVTVTIKPTAKVVFEPDEAAMLQAFLQRCAAVVASEAALVGGTVLAVAALVAGYILTYADGTNMKEICEEAARARKDFVDGFTAGVTPGRQYSFDNDSKMEGHNRGGQWLRDLQAGLNRDGLPVPESVLREKVREHQATAQASARAAINAYLHQWLVQHYWKIHWGRARLRWMGYGIETTFIMLMEEYGFGRPARDETGEQPAQEVAIGAP